MKLVQCTDLEILQIANPIMDNLMDASTKIDHARHIRDFTARAAATLPEDWFRSLCADYQASKGDFAQREFVALFRRPESVAIVWKQAFTRRAGEYLAEMILVEDGDRVLVEHVMVL